MLSYVAIGLGAFAILAVVIANALSEIARAINLLASAVEHKHIPKADSGLGALYRRHYNQNDQFASSSASVHYGPAIPSIAESLSLIATATAQKDQFPE